MNTVNVKALVANIRRERPYYTTQFSEYAITELAKNEISKSGDNDTLVTLTSKCFEETYNQLMTTAEDQKKLLQDCLEGDCEYPLEVIAEMTPRQKVKNWLEYNGIQGYTDDILDVVSAAYGIILEPDLNR